MFNLRNSLLNFEYNDVLALKFLLIVGWHSKSYFKHMQHSVLSLWSRSPTSCRNTDPIAKSYLHFSENGKVGTSQTEVEPSCSKLSKWMLMENSTSFNRYAVDLHDYYPVQLVFAANFLVCASFKRYCDNEQVTFRLKQFVASIATFTPLHNYKRCYDKVTFFWEIVNICDKWFQQSWILHGALYAFWEILFNVYSNEWYVAKASLYNIAAKFCLQPIEFCLHLFIGIIPLKGEVQGQKVGFKSCRKIEWTCVISKITRFRYQEYWKPA